MQPASRLLGVLVLWVEGGGCEGRPELCLLSASHDQCLVSVGFLILLDCCSAWNQFVLTVTKSWSCISHIMDQNGKAKTYFSPLRLCGSDT